MASNDLNYHLFTEDSLSVEQLKERFAQEMVAKADEIYNRKLKYRFQDVPGQPQEANLIFEDEKTGQEQAVLEFYGQPEFLKFHIRDSARGLPSSHVCGLLDKMHHRVSNTYI